LFRMGNLVKFIPMPVIEGFIAAIGAIIAITQFPVAVGILIKKSADDTLLQIIYQIIPQLPNINYNAALLTGITMGMIMVLPKFIPQIKTLSFPLAIATSAFLNTALSLNAKTLGAIPTSFTMPALDLSLSMLSELAVPILLMYGILSLESLLSALGVDKLSIERNKNMKGVKIPKELNTPHNSNQELMGQGIGNMTVGFLGGIPITGVIIRSSANVSIGGMTRRSSIVHSMTLAFAVFGVSSILSYIPLCSLAGILLATSYNMLHPRNFIKVFKIQPLELLPMVVTFIGILLTDLTVGFEIGFATQLGMWILTGMPLLRFSMKEEDKQVVVQMNGAINFLSKNKVDKILNELQTRSWENKNLLLDFTGIKTIDLSGAEGIDVFFISIELLCPTYKVVGCNENVKEIILKLLPSMESRFHAV